MKRAWLSLLVLLPGVLIAGDDHGDEPVVLQSLWLANLPELPADPSNQAAASTAALSLGHTLFFDTGLSRNGKVACANCHQPAYQFSDPAPRSQGLGTTRRRSLSLIGAAWQPWQYWDGRRDSSWAQALAPLEHSDEQGLSRTEAVAYVMNKHNKAYVQAFGPAPASLPGPGTDATPLGTPAQRKAWQAMAPQQQAASNQVFANIGKALAAYQGLLRPGYSRFDQYVAAYFGDQRNTRARFLTQKERLGLQLFIGKAQCVRCHNGPLFSNGSFHNTGVADRTHDVGRATGIHEADQDPFNCLGAWSDAPPTACAELRFANRDREVLAGSFRTPGLRNVRERPPYMHNGSLATLDAVIDHYNQAPKATIGRSELQPLGMNRVEKNALVAFLGSLSAPLRIEQKWRQAPTR